MSKNIPFYLAMVGIAGLFVFVVIHEPKGIQAEPAQPVMSDKINGQTSTPVSDSAAKPLSLSQDVKDGGFEHSQPLADASGQNLADAQSVPADLWLTDSSGETFLNPIYDESNKSSASASAISNTYTVEAGAEDSSSVSVPDTSSSAASPSPASGGSAGASSAGGSSGGGGGGGGSGGTSGASSGSSASSNTPVANTSTTSTSPASNNSGSTSTGRPVYNNIYYVSPAGSPSGSGTVSSPWDITSTFTGLRRVRPGDAVYLLEGIYRCPDRSLESQGYYLKLKGTADSPITISAAPNQHVLIDGGIIVTQDAGYLIVQNMEIMVSENLYMTRTLTETGSHPKSYGRLWGGLNILGGDNCKYINITAHDCAIGIQFWQDAKNSELYGCIIYDNGWDAPDRGHGHAIYTMNKDGTKTIENCIMTGGYGYTMHGYTTTTQPEKFVNNYIAQKNICYKANCFLFGGGNPSENIQLNENIFYKLDSVQLGYTAPYNYNCYVHDNYFVESPLTVKNFMDVDKKDNQEINQISMSLVGSVKNVFVFENRYDSNRAHVAVYNWANRSTIEVDVSSFLTGGDRYCFLNPRNLYQSPVKQGTYDGGTLNIPMSGYFAAFVLLKSSDGSTPQAQLGNAITIPIP